MKRWWLSPLWILSHIVVLTLVVSFVNLGLWQLRRLDQRQAQNELVSERQAQPPVPVGRLLDSADGFGPGGLAAAEAGEYRRVTATGTYRADQEVLVRGRSLNGAPGSWVLTPLERDDGPAVVVNRGWIPNDGRLEAVPAEVSAPGGEVSVTGLLRTTEQRGRFGPVDPATGTLATLARADIGRLAAQVPEPLLPAYVQLQGQEPAPGPDAPTPIPAPELDEGPHLGYAIQWFAFAAIAVIGYPLILRRAGRDRHRIDPDAPDPHDILAADDPRLQSRAGS